MKKLSKFGFLGKEPPTSLYESVINLSLFQTLTFSFDGPHSASGTWICNCDNNHTVEGLTWPLLNNSRDWPCAHSHPNIPNN